MRLVNASSPSLRRAFVGSSIRNASIEISLNFDEKKIFRSRCRERKKSSILFTRRMIFLRKKRLIETTDLFFSLDSFFMYKQSKSISKVVKADIYPEFGTYPGGGESLIIPFGDEKNAEREIIHGRWAQLGVTGAWAAENGTGIPWFTAGTLCTPDDCTAVADKFPGAVSPVGAGRLWLPVLLERFDHRNHLGWRCRRVQNWHDRPGL